MKKTKACGNGTVRRILYALIAAVFWLAVWFLISQRVDSELLFPSPVAVFRRIFELASEKQFYVTLFASLLRIVIGIAVAVVIGVVLAILTELFEPLKIIVGPAMTLIKATPVASFILLALVWISRTMIPVFIVILIVLPIIWGNVSEGIRGLDRGIIEMLRLYRVPFHRRLMRFYIPSVAPHFRSALLSSTGLGWKSGVAAEVLTVPAYAIGRMLFEAKQYLETVDLFAWTFAVIVLSYLIEKLFSWITRLVIQSEDRRLKGGERDA